MMIVMMLVWLLVLGGAVWLVWQAIRRWSDSPGTRRESPDGILKRRYAQGEIDRSTYEQMLDDFRRGSAVP